MKTKVIPILLLGANLFAASPGEDFSPDLKPVFSVLVSENDATSLIGKEFTANLTLKHASAKHLIFSDAFLVIDSETKYQIAKWIFTSELVQTYIGRKGIKCIISFRISNVNTDDKEMPYIIANITAIGEPKSEK